MTPILSLNTLLIALQLAITFLFFVVFITTIRQLRDDLELGDNQEVYAFECKRRGIDALYFQIEHENGFSQTLAFKPNRYEFGITDELGIIVKFFLPQDNSQWRIVRYIQKGNELMKQEYTISQFDMYISDIVTGRKALSDFLFDEKSIQKITIS